MLRISALQNFNPILGLEYKLDDPQLKCLKNIMLPRSIKLLSFYFSALLIIVDRIKEHHQKCLPILQI